MSKRVWIAILLQMSVFDVFSQVAKLDTLYYDKDWKVISNPAFASYYRIYDASDKTLERKPFRDYYITGELQGEGSYITLDNSDDHKSIMDGEWTNYYKSGKVEQKGYCSHGKQEGEYTVYYENGLIKAHVNMKNDKMNGILTQFNEAGDQCTQIEMLNDEPRYNYYIFSNKDGYSSKFRISDNTPIWESPNINEMKSDYKDGVAWPYYIKNGLIVATHNTILKDYGKWYQISIIISNHSMYPILFDPKNISSTLIKNNGENEELHVWSSDKYLKKVRRKQNWNMAMAGLASGLASYNAGYSSSSTNSYSTYGGYSTSQTLTYNSTEAYQQRLIESNRLANYENTLLNDRAIKQQGYLKKTTVYPGETISGYVNIKRTKGKSMEVTIDINGAKYIFPWNLSK